MTNDCCIFIPTHGIFNYCVKNTKGVNWLLIIFSIGTKYKINWSGFRHGSDFRHFTVCLGDPIKSVREHRQYISVVNHH